MKQPTRKSFKDQAGESRQFLKYTNVAFRMIVIILIGVFAGIKLDAYFGNEKSIFTLIFSLISVIAAMYTIIREISRKQ